MSEDKQKSSPKTLAILSYESGYERLINFISSNYYPLTRDKEKKSSGSEFFKALSLELYKPQSKEKIPSSTKLTEAQIKFINDFLENIYKCQHGFKQEGCLVLARWIDSAFQNNQDKRFAYILARAFLEKLLDNGLTGNETLVKSTGKERSKIASELISIIKKANKIIKDYEYVPDPLNGIGIMGGY